MKQAKKEKSLNDRTVKLTEDALMYRRMEAKELQRKIEHLQTQIDAIKLEAMEKIYK